MKHEMILSASGWRKIFAEDKDEQSKTTSIGSDNKVLSYLIGQTFSKYVKEKTKKESPFIVIATDTRPTGNEIAKAVLNACSCEGIKCIYLGYSAAPEIMAFSRNFDAFIYISASHNPVGHNGIKFGMNDGGVLEGNEAKTLIESFRQRCDTITEMEYFNIVNKINMLPEIAGAMSYKKKALSCYTDFIRHVISGCEKKAAQDAVFNVLRKSLKKNPLSVVCDMNGSARSVSIDRKFLPKCGLSLISFNDNPGEIAHEIIPEPENLVHCAKMMKRIHDDGDETAVLGYMPDCDGDRGNIVYWDEKKKEAVPIQAQEVFALCVLAELSFDYWKGNRQKTAVAVNCPTSMRIDEIASAFGAEVFRGEVGEANIVNLARKKRDSGYTVRIFGEGSNGGNITFPSSVRDPLASVFALLKLLAIRDDKDSKGLFHLWCEKSGRTDMYRDDFTLGDIIATIPQYTTTGVSEKRAVLQVTSEDKGILKERFRKIFERQWSEKKASLLEKYGISGFRAFLTNGTEEKEGTGDWNNGNGGLKVKFTDAEGKAVAFMWMRPSGTEPVFRVMCDVKGNDAGFEKELLSWETEMILEADRSF